MTKITKYTLVSTAMLLIFVGSSVAELSLEATYDVDQSLTVGTPAAGILQGSSTVSGGRFDAPLGGQYGDVSDGGCLYQAPATIFFDVSTDGISWGKNTIVAIIRLDSNLYGIRQSLMAVGLPDGFGGISSGDSGMQFYVNYGGGTAEANMGLALREPNNTDANEILIMKAPTAVGTTADWYVAASWSDRGTDSNIVDISLYARKVSDVTLGNTISYKADVKELTGAIDWDLHQILVGYHGYSVPSETNPGGLSNSLGGKIDLIRVYKGVYLGSAVEHGNMFKRTVAGDPTNCANALARGYGFPADLSGDCNVTLVDLSQFVEKWVECNDPAVDGCD